MNKYNIGEKVLYSNELHEVTGIRKQTLGMMYTLDYRNEVQEELLTKTEKPTKMETQTEKEKFRLDDLENGMLALLRNGKLYKVVKSKQVPKGFRNGVLTPLSGSGGDIGLNEYADTYNLKYFNRSTNDLDIIKLFRNVYKRDETIYLTHKEAIEALKEKFGKEVKIVKYEEKEEE